MLLAGLELGITPVIPQEVEGGKNKDRNKSKNKPKDSNGSGDSSNKTNTNNNNANSNNDNRNSNNNPQTTSEYTEDEGKFTKFDMVKIEEADPKIVQDLVKKSVEVAQVLKITTIILTHNFEILYRTQRQHW